MDCRLLRALADFAVGQGAERMTDHNRSQIGHSERVTLHPRLVQEFGGDDDRRRAAQGFESNAVMRTARGARPSIADRRQHDVVFSGDRRDQLGVGVLRKAFLAVIIDLSKRRLLAE